MKKKFYTIKMKLSVCLLVFMTCLGTIANAQTTLSAGDIAFTGYNSNDGSGGLQNQFTFVLLTNISAGTSINFTDNGYKVSTSTFGSAEGTMVWTSTTAMARFTQVSIQTNTAGNGIVGLSAGSISGGFSNFILSQAGDQVLAYQGTAGSPTFISGIHMNSDPSATQAGWDNMAAGTTLSANRSDVPPSLVSGSTCIAPDPNIGASERDNGVYNCTGSVGASVGAVRTSINTPANWSIQDLNPYTIPPSCTFSTASPLSATISGTNVLCNGANTGVASVSASGGVPAYSYAWAPSGGSGATATGLSTGNYTVTITDAATTQITRTITITQPASALATSTAVTNVVCNGGSNGVASITASGGAGGYTYLWNTGNTTSAITGKMAGAYTATVTDANSCTSIKSAIITQPSALNTSTAVTNVACNGGSNGVASITASGGVGGYTYLWSNGGTTSAITGLMAGAYSATVTDANSCTSIKSAVVTQPSALSTSTAVTNVVCNGGSNGVASITASGGAGSYSYLWSNGGTTSAITGLLAGAYTATVTDANSCTSIKSAIVTQPSAIVTTTAVTNVACNGGSNGVASITASGGAGGYTYLWSNGATTSAIPGLTFGAYTATVTDANSCTSIKTANITQPSALVTTTAVTNVACNGGSNGVASITASGGAGGYTYLWSNGATTSAITGMMFGAYTATVTDANSCTSIKTANITQPNALITSTAVTNVACNSGSNGSATITPSGGAGGYTYLWSNGATTSAITGVLAGAYSATVTDANSCTSIKSAVVTQPSALVTTTAVTNVACNGGSNGVASITASGGAGGYTYLWSNGATTSAITGLTFGVYTATVTDANSCTSIKSANISQPNALVTTTAVTNVACNGGSNGVASITASGGAGGYTYLWSNGATTSAITGLMAGAYTATVTDANSCTSIKTSNISQPNALVTTTAVTNVACNGGSNGSATITASGGAGGYTYLWSNGATTSAISGILAGAYSATVTDANSCTSIKTSNISQPNALVTTTAVTNIACNGGSNGSATITASGGAGSYTYLWSNGATTSAISGLLAGAYTATVTDANSCTSIKSSNISQPNALVTTTAVTNIACNGGSNGSATITASGGTPAYIYLWSNGATTSAISGLLAGAYSATVTDANNCTSSKSINISQPATALTSTLNSSNVLCNGGTGGATLTASGGTGAITYSWSNGATTPAISGVLTGAYTVTATDANNCTSVKTTTITQPASLTLTAVSSATGICPGQSVTLTASGSGGNGTINYSWVSGPTTSTFVVSPTATTIYTVNITDASSCSKSQTVSLTVFPSPTITAGSSTLCSGTNLVITPSGANTYSITGGSFTVSPAGPLASYSVTGTSLQGCAGSNTAVLTVSVLPTPTISANSATICSGNSVAIIPQASLGGVTFTITGGNYTVSPGTTTSYSITGRSANGCAASNTAIATVSVNATPTVVVNSATICSGSSVAITPSGANTYTISGGSYTVSPATTTTYVVTGTGTNACVSASVVSTISVNITPTITVNSGATCPGGIYTITPAGAGTYTISGGSFVVSPAVTTDYTVTGTGSTGCAASNTAIANVAIVNSLTMSVSGSTNVCSGRTTTLTASGTSNYSWSTGITTGTIALSPTVNTTYTVIGTSGSCSTSAVVSLSVLTTPTVVVSSTAVCIGTSVVITPSGANSYTITGGTFTVTPSATTDYSITGSNTQGCISLNTAVATVSTIALPTVAVNSGSICSGRSFTIIPSGASTYTISGGTLTVTPAATTAYSISGTSTAGCVSSASAIANVTVIANPTVTVSDYALCAGRTVTIVPGGAVSYTISGGTFTVNPSSSTAYSITGTNASGCVSSNTAVSNVTVSATPTIAVNSATTICSGNVAAIIPSGANTYTITGGSFNVSPSTTTSYSITGTSLQGCVGNNTAVTTVSVNATPTLVVNSGSICAGRSFTINPIGANTYTVTGGTLTVTPVATTAYSITGTSFAGCVSGNVVSNVTVVANPTITVSNYSVCLGKTVTVVPTGAGTGGTYTITGGSFSFAPTAASVNTYTINGTSAVGCLSSNNATLSVSSLTLPVISVLANTTICSGASLAIVPSGATTYTITGGNFTVTPSATTSYSITGTTNGCVSSNTAAITVSVNASPTITVNSGAICLNNTFVINPSGANTYTVSGGSFSVNPIADASYTVTGTGTNNCVSSVAGIASITVNPLPVVVVNSGVICPGNTFTFFPTGAVTYTYSNGSNTVTPLASANYSITGASALGCLSSNTAISTVSVVNTVTIEVLGNTSICAGESTDLIATGANSYSWSTGATTSTVNLSPVSNTNYTVSGMSGNCSNTLVLTVTVNVLPTVAVNGGVICKGQNFTITPTGASSYVYSTGSAIITPASDLTFTVTGTSAQGCTSANHAVATVTVNPLPAVLAAPAAPIVCIGESTVLNASGATSYSWSTNESAASITVTPTANTAYTVTGTDVNGCSKSVDVMQLVDNCTAINKLNSSNMIFGLYPNPNSGEFTIETQGNAEITVINATGQVVYSETTTNLKTSVSVKELAKGIYFVKAVSNGKQHIVKMIKE